MINRSMIKISVKMRKQPASMNTNTTLMMLTYMILLTMLMKFTTTRIGNANKHQTQTLTNLLSKLSAFQKVMKNLTSKIKNAFNK